MLLLQDGRGVCQGHVGQLLSNLPHPHLRELWDATPRLAVS
jgi:ABC-type glutathione transport system ATPase component